MGEHFVIVQASNLCPGGGCDEVKAGGGGGDAGGWHS